MRNVSCVLKNAAVTLVAEKSTLSFPSADSLTNIHRLVISRFEFNLYFLDGCGTMQTFSLLRLKKANAASRLSLDGVCGHLGANAAAILRITICVVIIQK